jgi:CheY-like chemotaxis protein
MRDMTEQKHNSDELSRLASELSEESRRKNEFLATLAHELRNPLSPIKSAVQLMSMMDVTDEVSELRVMMERQVEQIVRLLDDLMDVSRIGRGKIELKKQVVEIRTIIDAAIENSQALVDSNHQHLSIDASESGLCVNVDPARLTQVICNLINNASKYSDVDCTISVSAKQIGEHVAVVVRDNGSGIAPERIEGIFEMFAQIEDSIERGTAGLGIGLTLVRTFVDLHGGTVGAASDGIGKGSEFTIKLPVAVTPAMQDQADADNESAVVIRPTKVLVVDDMRVLSVVLSRLLMKFGHEVCIVDSGPEAIKTLETFDAEVIFSDISMPGMTGYELAKRLRVDHADRPMTLVAMTGYGQASDREKALAAGFDEHMVKPVDFKVLQAFFQNRTG